ncbi:Fe-S cluster assembly protein SufD [Flavilitoribacter nigricans]|uniref:Fe-S cluster assembly protein SufD n=1 Tax=Flavilitoribacter nigricans (strain ATCC 23147 / DSM 23189 / NBRC 102662 / NCIMB 1420 / SS-2) TaxID=1122177 RepID=A0A2D0N8U2_FLAN2|nr:Fe-S cluster assembly protein SufD [Flavilitoribacter nigricans]PHN04931.1 Fe-S cluster assembly protein SufD [Flavilitoribacter nigricans DSM 23189 = NBRC 102662]
MSTATLQDRYAEVKDRFRSLFNVFEGALNGHRDQPMHTLRKAGIERLDVMDFPTRRDENWKYTSLNQMLRLPLQDSYQVEVDAATIDGLAIPGLDAARIVLVNGLLQTELSDLDKIPEGMELLPVDQALEDEAVKGQISEMLDAAVKNDHNPFSALNVAFAKNGFVLKVKAKAVVEKPVHIIHLAAPTGEPVFINPLLLVLTGAHSEGAVVETYDALPGADQAYFSNILTRVHVGVNAHFHHYRIQNDSAAATVVSNIEAHQQQDSTFSSYLVDLGGDVVRNNLSTILQGQNTMTNYYGVYLAKGKQHIDNQTFIDHALPHCGSNELYKGILDDRGRGVFNGKVIVRQDAQKTNAFQQNSSLVLSKTAEMDTKPQLEIFADDVRCSHGATIGQLDESSVFYLRSRGLSDLQARQLLQQAFLFDVVENMPLEAVKDYAEQLIEKKLK